MAALHSDEPADGHDSPAPGWTEIADAVWLAAVARQNDQAPPEAFDPIPPRAPPDELPVDPRQPVNPPVVSPPETGATTPQPAGYREERHPVAEPDDTSQAALFTALPDSRRVARAFQPLKRRVLSATEMEPDEEATAEYATDTGFWMPQFRPVEARWLAAVLIVDDSPSMAVWRPTAAAFRLLLERHGSFRSVRTLHLSPANGGPSPVPPRLYDPTGGTRSPAELLDPSGRQLFLVFTDGTSPLWRNPGTDRLLRLWGTSGPLAIVNPYPQGHWHRGDLSPRRCRLRAPRPVVPNDALEVQYAPELRNPFDELTPEQSLPVPVLELSARWLRWWVRVVTEPSGWLDAVVHATDPSTPPPLPPEGDPGSPTERVVRFRAAATPTAFQLATYLAAAPLELPLLRRIQQSVLPHSAPHHLAEVVTSDLVYPVDDRMLSFEFVPGVREALLACTTRDSSARVIRAVAANQRHRNGAGVAFTRTIEAPDLTLDPPVTRETLPSARIELAVLDALSGPYARRARRLRDAIAAVEQGRSGVELDQPGVEISTPGLQPPVPATAGTGDVSTDEAGRGGHEDGEVMAVQPEPPRRSAEAPEGPAAPGYPSEDLDLPESNPLTEDDAILSLQEILGGQSPDKEPVVWGKVPTRNLAFTGRRALMEQLERRLRTQSVAAVLPQALHGEGGVGKSQIAIEYAYRHRADYDVIWWVPSERPAQILASLIELGNRLGLDVGKEVITAVPRVRAALRAGTPYSNWLLVFDNAETLETVQDYLPESGTGKVLVTSRNQEWSRVAETLEVDVFARQESIRFLQRRNEEISEADADRLAEALGDLPLAIEHASAWLAVTGMEIGEYLGLLTQKREELAALVPSPGYEMPVAAAANIALDRLAVENPAALQMLQVCSFFAPEPINQAIFTGARQTGIAAELDEALQTPAQLGRAIRDIQKYVLARIDHGADTLQLHRLVQAVLQGRMPAEQRTAMEHGAHVLLAGGANWGKPSDPENWLRYQALASHLTASNAVGCEDDWTRALVISLVEFYFYWGDYGSGRELAHRVVDEWRHMLGLDHRQTLQAAKWLGYYWWVAGEYDAAAAIQADNLRRYQRTAGPDDEGTLDAMSMVAITLRTAGRFADARDLDFDAFRRSRQHLGGNDPVTLKVAHNLGVSLRLTGEFRTARQLDSDTFRRRRAVLGDDHPETLRTLNNLVIDERECGEYVNSRHFVEQIYARYVGLFGVEHLETIRIARNLAVARRRAGDHENAYKLAEDTMNRFRERFGPSHPDAIAAALNFAVDIRERDDVARAQVLAAQTAESYHNALGADHPYTLYARTNLGIVLRLLGHRNEAYEHNLAAWTTLRRMLGSHHVLSLTCAVNLASDMYALGDHQGAHDLDIEMLQLSRQVIGMDHPSTLACAHNLAMDLAALGHTDKSERLYEETLQAYIRILGEEHPAIRAARSWTRANCDVDPMPF
jgi:hypothetical protein